MIYYSKLQRFLKFLNHRLLQIRLRSCTKLFRLLPPLDLLDFSTRPFSSKALKIKPSSSMFQMFLNSLPEVSSDRRSIDDWMVIFGMLSTLPVILISRSLYVCLNFSSHLFDAVNIANSSLLNISFINIASFFNTGPSGNTFLYQAMRISLIKWHCPCLNFFQFSLQNSYPLEELLRSLTHLRRKSYYWNFLYPILKNFKSPGILYFDFCLHSW